MDPNVQTITVLGAGYVGLTTAALLAHCGYTVYLIEPNKKRLDVIKQGRSFFFEEGLDPVIKLAIDSGKLTALSSYEESVAQSDVVFSCVGTPDNPDGSSNLSYVFSAAEETARHAKPGVIYVQKSTVPVGTGRKIEKLFESLEKDIRYVSNPEFLREGTALYDTLYFDRVVVGGDAQPAVSAVMDIYIKLEQFRGQIAHTAGIPVDLRGNLYIATDLNSAELIKVTSNAFLALKVSFANSIAMLADKSGADVVKVMDAVGADNRIGRAFLGAGRGYGGGCFPKDVSGLISSGLEYGVNLDILQAAKEQNQKMPGYVVDKLQNAIEGQLQGKKVAVLGLAFKAGTSDVRKSPGVDITNRLLDAGANVVAYDPQANEEAKKFLNPKVVLQESVIDTIKGADAIIFATEWDDFKALTPKIMKDNMAGHYVLDAVNMLDKQPIQDAGLTYLGVGR